MVEIESYILYNPVHQTNKILIYLSSHSWFHASGLQTKSSLLGRTKQLLQQQQKQLPRTKKTKKQANVSVVCSSLLCYARSGDVIASKRREREGNECRVSRHQSVLRNVHEQKVTKCMTYGTDS